MPHFVVHYYECDICHAKEERHEDTSNQPAGWGKVTFWIRDRWENEIWCPECLRKKLVHD